MAFSSWRGTVGIVRPTLRTGGFEDLVRMLPEGIGVIPLILNVRRGAVDEFKTVIPAYEEKVAELAQAGVRCRQPVRRAALHGARLRQGTGADPRLAEEIQHPHLHLRHQPCRCAARARAFAASSAPPIFAATSTASMRKYFTDAGFECLAMAGMDVDFDKAQELSSFEVYRFIKSEFLAHRGAEAIYMLGPAWRTLDIVDMLEQDLGVPVVHAIPAQCWDIQRHLHVRQPVQGFGRLVAEMPDGPTMAVSRPPQRGAEESMLRGTIALCDIRCPAAFVRLYGRVRRRFYQGKQITIVVGFFGRRHLRCDRAAVRAPSRQASRRQSDVIVRNMPGAGSMVATIISITRRRRTARRSASSAAAPCWSRCSATRRPNTTPGNSPGSAAAPATISCAWSGTPFRSNSIDDVRSARPSSARPAPARAR